MFRSYPKRLKAKLPSKKLLQDKLSLKMKQVIEIALIFVPAEIVFFVTKAMLSLRGNANALPVGGKKNRSSLQSVCLQLE